MSDVFSEMTEPAEARPDKDGNVKRAGMMWVRAPAVNSLELAISAMRVADEMLQRDIDFVETEIEGEWLPEPPAPTTPESHALAQARSALASLYLEHESIARSLGGDGPTNKNIYARYVAICKDEGLVPLVFPDYK